MSGGRASGSEPSGRAEVRRGVIGLGNPLRGDDGVVSRLFASLRDRGTASDVELIELGAPNLRLVHALGAFDRVLIVDAMRFGGTPGTHTICSPDEIRSRSGSEGSHGTTLLELLEFADALDGSGPAVTIFGIEPGQMTPGAGLSRPVEARLPALRAALAAAIDRL